MFFLAIFVAPPLAVRYLIINDFVKKILTNASRYDPPYLALKTRNSSELYCGPLSEISLSGILCSSKIPLR